MTATEVRLVLAQGRGEAAEGYRIELATTLVTTGDDDLALPVTG
jgi:hypothetical protein